MWILCCSHLHHAEETNMSFSHTLNGSTAQKLRCLHNCRCAFIAVYQDNPPDIWGGNFIAKTVVSKDHKIKVDPVHGSIFCLLCLQGGRRTTTSPLIHSATTRLTCCTVFFWRITTIASVRWKKWRAWTQSSSSVPAQRTSATRTSSSAPVSLSRTHAL